MEYLSDFQTALKWDVTVEQVRKGCIYGLVNGAVYKNGVWMIPENKERPNNFLRFIDGAESLERKNNLTRNEKKEKENGKTTVLYDNTKYLSDKVACERAIWKRFPALERVLYVASYASDNRKICSKDRKELVRLDKVVVLNDKRNHRHTYAYYQCPVCKRKYVSLDDARNIILLIQDKGPTRKLPTVDSRKTGKTAIPVGVTTNTGRRVSSQKTKKPTPAKQRKRGNEQKQGNVKTIIIKNGQIIKEPKGWAYYVVMHSFDSYMVVDLNSREYRFETSEILDRHMKLVRGEEEEKLRKYFDQKCDREIRTLLNRYEISEDPGKPFILKRNRESSIEKYPLGTVLNKNHEYAVCIVKSAPGHIEILDMRSNLDIVEGDALYDGTYELFADDQLSRNLQAIFFKKFPSYFESAKGDYTASLLKTEMDLDIGAKDFVVRSNTFRCLHKHHSIENINAVVTIIDAKSGIHFQYRTPAGYCRQCHTYFISDSTFENIKSKGVALCRICDEKTYRKQGKTINANGMHLASESILMQYGYNVNQQRNLSERTRRSILESLVDYRILSKADIESYLNFFIRGRQRDPKFHTAVSKWKADRDYILHYKQGAARDVTVRSIRRK